MPRFAAGAKTSAGTVQWPMLSLYSAATTQPVVREIGIFNTTTTAFDVKLGRIATALGTLGAGLSEAPIDNPLAAAGAMAFTTNTGGTQTITDLGYRASIGAAIGAGVIWTFGAEGIEIAAAAGTANAVCVVPENGAGQAAQVYVVWDE